MGSASSVCRTDGNVKTSKQRNNGINPKPEALEKVDPAPVDDARNDVLSTTILSLAEAVKPDVNYPGSVSETPTPRESGSLSHSELTAKLTNRDFQDSVHSKRRFAVKAHRGSGIDAGSGGERGGSTDVIRVAPMSTDVAPMAESADPASDSFEKRMEAEEVTATEVNSAKVEDDVTFEDLENEDAKDSGDGDGMNAGTAKTSTATGGRGSAAAATTTTTTTTKSDDRQILDGTNRIDLTLRKSDGAVAKETSTMKLGSESSSSSTSASKPLPPTRTITFPLSVTSGGQSYILTTADAAVPKGGRLPPIKRAPPLHLRQKLQHHRRHLPPPGVRERGAVPIEGSVDEEGKSGSVAATAGAEEQFSAAAASSVEERLAAASRRREENLGRRANASRRNQERGDEVRRRREEKRSKAEEWREKLKKNQDESLRKTLTKELFEEIQF